MYPGWNSRTAIRAFVTGASITGASTLLSCSLAVVVEGCANKTLYFFFPHLYRDVEYAYGLDLQQQRRRQRREQQRHCRDGRIESSSLSSFGDFGAEEMTGTDGYKSSYCANDDDDDGLIKNTSCMGEARFVDESTTLTTLSTIARSESQ
mmetsp:Transcript_14247/g.17955  ORF Transcript_14247/g.17955 Transcript_14247/m.17955 type:complete len:150 (+) Transcript_14247:307-756(+)